MAEGYAKGGEADYTKVLVVKRLKGGGVMEEIGMGRANSVGCEKAILKPAISNPVRKIIGSRMYSI